MSARHAYEFDFTGNPVLKSFVRKAICEKLPNLNIETARADVESCLEEALKEAVAQKIIPPYEGDQRNLVWTTNFSQSEGLYWELHMNYWYYCHKTGRGAMVVDGMRIHKEPLLDT